MDRQAGSPGCCLELAVTAVDDQGGGVRQDRPVERQFEVHETPAPAAFQEIFRQPFSKSAVVMLRPDPVPIHRTRILACLFQEIAEAEIMQDHDTRTLYQKRDLIDMIGVVANMIDVMRRL